jgi:SulP family sulfate permease
MANMAAGLFGGVTTATATMRTVANIKFGGKTPLASVIHGVTLLAILLGLGSLVESIPEACLAAILFKVGIDILDYRIIPVLRRIPTTDLLIFIIVLFVTVYEDLMVAVTLGVIFAFLKSIKEIKSTSNHKIISFSKSKFYLEDQNKQENIKVLDLEGPLFFGSIVSLMKNYNDVPKHEILIIDMTNVTMIDLSGIYVLEDIINAAKANNVRVFVSNAKSHIKKVLEKVSFIENLREENCKDLIKQLEK